MVRIAKYKANRKSLETDSRVLHFIWELCQIAGGNPVTATQQRLAALLAKEGICEKRTFEDSSRRLANAGWLWRFGGRGKAAYAYFVPLCAMRRMDDAKQNPRDEYDLYESVVCYHSLPGCNCASQMMITNFQTFGRPVRVMTIHPKEMLDIYYKEPWSRKYWDQADLPPIFYDIDFSLEFPNLGDTKNNKFIFDDSLFDD